MSAEFVDTNIIVYAYDRSDPRKHKTAGALLGSLWKNQQGCLSIQVLQELYVTLTTKTPAAHEQAVSIVTDLGVWKHHVPVFEDLLEAARIRQQYGVSFRDAMVITSACRMDCRVLWTEDLNHGQIYAGVEVLNPFLVGRGGE